MQALNVELNPGNNLKSINGSKSCKVSSTAKNASGKNKKFAEIYEQLLILPPTAMLAGKVQQSGSEKVLMSTALGEDAGAGTKKSKLLGNEADLLSAVLSAQVSNAGKLINATKIGTVAEAEITASKAKSTSNETAKLTDWELKLIKAAEQQAGTPVKGEITSNTAKSASNEKIGLTNEGLKLIMAAEQQTSAAAGAEITASKAKSASNETIRLTDEGLKLIKLAEQQAGTTAKAEITSNTAKSASNETIKLTGDELKRNKTEKQQVSETTETKVDGITTKPINNENIKPTGDEVKLIKAAGKKVSEAAESQDAAGEVNQPQPNINNSQATTEKTEAGKSIMSKSQIDFIVTNLAAQIKSGASSLEINLQPESLGKIKLMLQMDKGSLAVQIIAHTKETRDLLDSSLQNIKDSLNQQGINLNDMSVDLANQEKQGNQNGSGYSEENKPSKRFAELKESYDNIGTVEQNSLQSNGLNILA